MKNALSAILALAFIAQLAVPAPALAGQSVRAELRALQHRLDVLSQQNRKQEHRLHVLERQVGSMHRRGRTAPSALAAFDAVVRAPQAAPEPAPRAAYADSRAITSMPPAASAPVTPLGTPGPQEASVKAAYQAQNALFQKGLTITPSVTYSYGDTRFFTLNGFMALGAIFLGNIDVARQQNTVYEPSVNLTDAVNNHEQFDLTVPVVARTSVYTSSGAQNASNMESDKVVSGGGIGDISAGMYYALPKKTVGGPSVIVNAHVTVPTGTSPYGVKIIQQQNGNDNISYAQTLPTGGGVWGLDFGATMIEQADPAILFGGVNFYHNFAGSFADISPDAGTIQPGAVKPGDALNLTMGTAFALNDRMSMSFSIQDTLVQSAMVRPLGQIAWNTVAGSSLNAALFNIGTTFAVNPRTTYQMLLGIGITQDAPNFQFTVRAPHT